MRKEDVKNEKDIVEYLKGWPEFERDVYLATFKIPKGMVSTYGTIARMIGRPNASRAVGNALHKNPLWPMVPCHRVVRSDGGFGGRPGHASGRRKRCEEEGIPIKGGKVVMSDEILFQPDRAT